MDIFLGIIVVILVIVCVMLFLLLANARNKIKEENNQVEYNQQLIRDNHSVRQNLESLQTYVNELRLQSEGYAKQYENESNKLKNVVQQNENEKNSLKQEYEELIGNFGIRLTKDTIKAVMDHLTPNNFATSHKKIDAIIEFCRKNGFNITNEEEIYEQLKAEYERVLRKDFLRQEQARIKAQIREEEQLQRERDRELQKLENERLAIETALQKALAKAKDEHNAEVERLREKLVEAEARSQRAQSQAQITKSGYVYVLSNIGSFGERVFKVGQTRRLDPMDRVKELSDASVPFPFDVHMLISCDDAPGLENALHRAMHKNRVNKINLRKEYFNVDLDTIIKLVEDNYGVVEYVAEPEALEFRESQNMTLEDYEFVTKELEEVSSTQHDPTDN